ncbi:FAD-dependent oxidoreductase [Pseudomonas sp. Marseille-P9899]|uniref:FAD-dependent oxidoreductase n=1 Tax=Pseudomonas sp. Marseille-P9899 TaxID=2730401 RepID=UPI00158AC365|nr:NAD(P)/FAD-dependent oxidoreductase [Pseudomonas sp. Marseille-P9899]
MSLSSPSPGLDALEQRLAEDLEWLGLPAREWIPEQTLEGQPVLPVVIVGGGMAGLALAAELKHLGVPACLFDKADEGLEGPWITTARMETLRSPKQLSGPALGLPALTFRAWFQAQFGVAAWDALDKIPRLQWAQYLRWYRQVLKLEVRNRHRVANVDASREDHVRLHVESPGGDFIVLARHVVLATGRDGLGGPWVPEIATALPRHLWAHSADGLHDEHFAGKRVAVVGGGASAMDAAATALEAGAQRVDLLIRRAQLPRVNKGKGAGSPGMTHGYWRLPDAWKWRIRRYLEVQQVPPPQGSTLRVSKHGNARFLFDSPLESVVVGEGDELLVRTPQANLTYDFIVFATGFRNDLATRAEFAGLAPHVRVWSDHAGFASNEGASELAQLPDLGAQFEFQEAHPGSCPGLGRVHCFNYPAALTYGGVSGDIPAISDGAKRIAQALAGQLFGEDITWHFAQMQAYEEPELQGDEWTAGVLAPEELL